jgi:hypothetical protein
MNQQCGAEHRFCLFGGIKALPLPLRNDHPQEAKEKRKALTEPGRRRQFQKDKQ